METLLNEQELYLSPQSGSYDADRVASAIMSIDYALHDEFVPSVFLLFLDETGRETCRAARHADPKAPLPYVLLIDVTPQEICVNQFAGSEHDEQSRRFLTWMAENYPGSRLCNEASKDLNEAWAAVVDSAAGK